MNKKIIVGSLLACFVIVGVSMVSAASMQTKEKEIKESPLFRIRKDNLINKGKTTFKNIVTKFLENRVFIRFSFFNKDICNTPAFTKIPTGDVSTCQCYH